MRAENNCNENIDRQSRMYEKPPTKCGGLHHKLRREKVEQHLDAVVSEERTILDIGCAEGYYIRYITSRCHQGLGLDLEAEAIERAYIHTSGLNKTHFILGNAESLPFKDRSIDVILCSEVLEHVACPEECMREICRVVSDRGFLVVSVPTEASSLLSPLWGILVKIRLIRPYNYGHLRSFHSDAFLKLIERHGFRIYRSDSVHIYYLDSLLYGASRVSKLLARYVDTAFYGVNICLNKLILHTPFRRRGVVTIVSAQRVAQDISVTD